jgi:hypothetical protein
LPVPDSPVIKTGARVVDTAPICFQTSRIGWLLPRIAPACGSAAARETNSSRCARAWRDSSARLITVFRCSISTGFTR